MLFLFFHSSSIGRSFLPRGKFRLNRKLESPQISMAGLVTRAVSAVMEKEILHPFANSGTMPQYNSAYTRNVNAHTGDTRPTGERKLLTPRSMLVKQEIDEQQHKENALSRPTHHRATSSGG